MNNYYRNPYNSEFIQEPPLTNKGQMNLTNQARDTETFLKDNIGKRIKVYMSFPDSIEWRDRIFEGTLQSVGLDYILIKDSTNTPILLQKIYMNYATFNETVNY